LDILGEKRPRLSAKSEVLARIGDNGLGHEPGQFLAPLGLAVDSRGDLYVGEVSNTAWPLIYPEQPRPDNLRVLRKLVRVKQGAVPS
jgi:hypothetical protein